MSIYRTSYANTYIDIGPFIENSNKELDMIFSTISINESDLMIVREASIKDLFRRVKEFFKKLWGKIIEAIRNIRKKSIDNQKSLYEYYMKNQIAINYALYKAKKGELTIEGERNWYADFGLDSNMRNSFRALDGGSFNLQNMDIQKISMYALKQQEQVYGSVNILGTDVEFKHSNQIDEDKMRDWIEFNKASAMKSILASLGSLSNSANILRKIYDRDNETDWDKIKQSAIEIFSGKVEPFTKNIASSIQSNLEGIIKSGPSASKAIEEYSKMITDEYNAGMKKLEEVEKALMNDENVIPERVPKVVNMYSSYFKYILDKYLDMFNFVSSIRDKQIATYLRVCKEFVAKNSKKKAHKESALFSSVQFI